MHKTHISGKQDVTAYTYNILEEANGVNSAFKKDSNNKDLLNTSDYDSINAGEQDDFRRIQEESRRVYAETIQQGMGYELNENERSRIKRSLRRELERRGHSDSSNRGLNVIQLGDSSDATKTYNLYDNVDGQTFKDMFEIVRTYTANGELVDIHDIETTEDGIGYNDCKNYLSDDGLSGFSVTPDGDLISVFDAKTINGKKGFLKAISPIIIENTKTLDCYASHNQPYNIALNHGKPKVAFMVNTNEDVITKHFNKDQYDEALEYRNSFVNKNNKFSKGLSFKDLEQNSKDLTESSFKTLSNDYNIKDPKLRELYDEMIDDIKTSGIVFKDTHDNIVDYIVNNSKEKVENYLDKFVKRLVKYNNSLAYRIYDGIRNLVSKTDTLKDIEYNFLKAFRDSGMNPSNVRITKDYDYSYSVGMSYRDIIENIYKGNYDDTQNAIMVKEKSPSWLVEIGNEDYPISMTYTHIKSDMGIGKKGNQHNVSKDITKELPSLLEDPIAVYPSKNDSSLAILKASDKDGKVIVTAIKPNAKG